MAQCCGQRWRYLGPATWDLSALAPSHPNTGTLSIQRADILPALATAPPIVHKLSSDAPLKLMTFEVYIVLQAWRWFLLSVPVQRLSLGLVEQSKLASYAIRKKYAAI